MSFSKPLTWFQNHPLYSQFFIVTSEGVITVGIGFYRKSDILQIRVYFKLSILTILSYYGVDREIMAPYAFILTYIPTFIHKNYLFYLIIFPEIRQVKSNVLARNP